MRKYKNETKHYIKLNKHALSGITRDDHLCWSNYQKLLKEKMTKNVDYF